MVLKIGTCLEIGPRGTGAFVPSCPGCWVFGRTPERAVTKAKAAVAEWFEWAKKHGEQALVEAKDSELEVIEMLKVTYDPVEAGKPEPLFWSEVLPITRKDVPTTLRLMDYSRQDLLRLVSGLTDDCLDWRPESEPRTPRNCLRHIAYVEPWYITRLNVDLRCRYSKSVLNMLEVTRKAVVDYLEKFPREKMRGVFQPTKDSSPVCDLWTSRKVLRRLVDHERLHTRYIEKILRMYENK
jgi:predicted RNase H-like HicB family nuclease